MVGLLTSRPGFCFFHFVRLFWNLIKDWMRSSPSQLCNLAYQILTCVSVRLKLSARLRRSQTERYRVVLNLFSSDTNCSYVKAVRALLGEKGFALATGGMDEVRDWIYLRGFELLPDDFPSPLRFESLILESVSLPSISLPSASSHMSSGSMSFRSFTAKVETRKS